MVTPEYRAAVHELGHAIAYESFGYAALITLSGAHGSCRPNREPTDGETYIIAGLAGAVAEDLMGLGGGEMSLEDMLYVEHGYEMLGLSPRPATHAAFRRRTRDVVGAQAHTIERRADELLRPKPVASRRLSRSLSSVASSVPVGTRRGGMVLYPDGIWEQCEPLFVG